MAVQDYVGGLVGFELVGFWCFVSLSFGAFRLFWVFWLNLVFRCVLV